MAFPASGQIDATRRHSDMDYSWAGGERKQTISAGNGQENWKEMNTDTPENGPAEDG